jgi:predicted ATPase
MRIQRLILFNWKNFQIADIALGDRMFIIGPNASGKSNFLDVFRFLRDVARGQGGGLQQAIKDRGGLSKVRCYGARKNPLVEIEIHLGELNTELPDYRYRLGLSQEPRGSRRPLVKYEEVFVKGKKVLQRPDGNDRDDPERLTETHLEQTAANKEFRDIVSFFNSVCYLHIVPQMVRSPEAGSNSGQGDDPFGRTFLERMAKTPEKTRRGRLKRIENALKIIAPHLRELSFDRDEKGQPHLIARYEHWRPDAGQQNETQFSDGTLRAIGLLWALQEGTSLLLIEEPELSLNAEIVKEIPAMLSSVSRKNKRQIVVSTHSRDLLSDKGIAPEETIILKTEKEGTIVSLASDDSAVMALYESGLPISEAALSLAAPLDAFQLSLNFENGGETQ